MSNFRNYIEGLEQDHMDRIGQILNQDDDISFFFTIDGKVFGGPEDSRLTFARMKNPDPEADKSWGKEANFIGFDIETAAKDKKENAMKLFNFGDLKKIKIISQDVANKMLEKK